MKLTIDGEVYDVGVAGEQVSVGGKTFEVKVEGEGTGTTVIVNGRRYKVHRWASGEGNALEINVDGKIYRVEISGGVGPARKPAARRPRHGPTVVGAVTALMPGRVVRVDVTEGQVVDQGDVLLVLEAMKMENEIRAEAPGTVKVVAVKAGASVAAGDTLVVIE